MVVLESLTYINSLDSTQYGIRFLDVKIITCRVRAQRKKTTNSTTNRRLAEDGPREPRYKFLPEAELSRLLSAVSVAEDYFFTAFCAVQTSETGPVQRFAGSEYFSFDKILQQNIKPLPEQQTRRLHTDVQKP